MDEEPIWVLDKALAAPHVVVERRQQGSGASASYARVVDLQPAARAPQLEADREAEGPVDRGLSGKFAQ